jgi:MFS superfamily sulfate permease-like transporter
VLAAVVLGAITGLFKFSTLKQLWKHDHPEFVVAVAAFAGVLTFGLLRGVLIGAAISLVQLVTVSAHPHVALLGRIPGTRRYSDCERHTDNELIRDVMIFRPEVGLFYFNIDYVCDAILNRVNATTPPPTLVVLDLSAAPRIDMQSANTLASMATELTDRGIRFHAVEPRSSVRDRLRLEGVDSKLGGVNRFTGVADVVEDFQREREPPSRNLQNSVVA